MVAREDVGLFDFKRLFPSILTGLIGGDATGVLREILGTTIAREDVMILADLKKHLMTVTERKKALSERRIFAPSKSDANAAFSMYKQSHKKEKIPRKTKAVAKRLMECANLEQVASKYNPQVGPILDAYKRSGATDRYATQDAYKVGRSAPSFMDEFGVISYPDEYGHFAQKAVRQHSASTRQSYGQPVSDFYALQESEYMKPERGTARAMAYEKKVGQLANLKRSLEDLTGNQFKNLSHPDLMKAAKEAYERADPEQRLLIGAIADKYGKVHQQLKQIESRATGGEVYLPSEKAAEAYEEGGYTGIGKRAGGAVFGGGGGRGDEVALAIEAITSDAEKETKEGQVRLLYKSASTGDKVLIKKLATRNGIAYE